MKTLPQPTTGLRRPTTELCPTKRPPPDYDKPFGKPFDRKRPPDPKRP